MPLVLQADDTHLVICRPSTTITSARFYSQKCIQKVVEVAVAVAQGDMAVLALALAVATAIFFPSVAYPLAAAFPMVTVPLVTVPLATAFPFSLVPTFSSTVVGPLRRRVKTVALVASAFDFRGRRVRGRWASFSFWSGVARRMSVGEGTEGPLPFFRCAFASAMSFLPCSMGDGA